MRAAATMPMTGPMAGPMTGPIACGQRTGAFLLRVRGWLVLCIAIFLAASASLYDPGHVHAFPSGKASHAMHGSVSMDGPGCRHAAQCVDRAPGAACCVAGPGCNVCGSLPAALLAEPPQGVAFGGAGFPASRPGDVRFETPPPRLSVTA